MKTPKILKIQPKNITTSTNQPTIIHPINSTNQPILLQPINSSNQTSSVKIISQTNSIQSQPKIINVTSTNSIQSQPQIITTSINNQPQNILYPIQQQQYTTNIGEINKKVIEMKEIYNQRNQQMKNEIELNNQLIKRQNELQKKAENSNYFDISYYKTNMNEIMENKQKKYIQYSTMIYQMKYKDILDFDISIDFNKFSLIPKKSPLPQPSLSQFKEKEIEKEEIIIKNTPYEDIEMNISLEKYIETKKMFIMKRIIQEDNIHSEIKNIFTESSNEFKRELYKKPKKNVDHYCYFFKTETGNIYGYEIKINLKDNKIILFKFFVLLPVLKIFNDIHLSDENNLNGIYFTYKNHHENTLFNLDFTSKTIQNIPYSIQKYFPSNKIISMSFWKLKKN